MSFAPLLRPASFRGIPFGVLGSGGRFGRRLALHEYPFRDDPYPEDLGRAMRRINLRGFLVANDLVYGGGDINVQLARIIAAAETAGAGTLIHPRLGSLQVTCPELMVEDGVENGINYVALGFSFIQAGTQQFPVVTIDTGSQVTSAAGLLDLAAAARYALRAASPLVLGAAIIGEIGATVASWIAIGSALAADATTLFRLASGLDGFFGRYFSGRNAGFTGIRVTANPRSSTASLIVLGATLRATIAAAATALETAAATGDSAAISLAAQDYAAALLAAAADPADGVRLTAALVDFAPDAATSGTPIGSAMATVQDACGDLCRRAALSALARAAQAYQPSSADDAVTVRNQVVGLIEDEITIAGDQGEDDVYGALTGLRLAVATDLNARGAALAPLVDFALPASLPALALAHRIYRDAGRADELVTEANPPHPMFMPQRFRALAR